MEAAGESYMFKYLFIFLCLLLLLDFN